MKKNNGSAIALHILVTLTSQCVNDQYGINCKRLGIINPINPSHDLRNSFWDCEQVSVSVRRQEHCEIFRQWCGVRRN